MLSNRSQVELSLYLFRRPLIPPMAMENVVHKARVCFGRCLLSGEQNHNTEHLKLWKTLLSRFKQHRETKVLKHTLSSQFNNRIVYHQGKCLRLDQYAIAL